MVTIKSDREIELMKEACKVVALTYKKLEEVIKPGMSTWELDQIAEKTMRDLGALPAEKGYDPGIRGVPPYPAARTFIVGDVPKETRRLVDVTKQAFFEGIKYAKPGNRIGDICHAIGEYVHSQGYSVVREFQGHGIGRQMHEDPGIPNYGKAGRGIRLEPGMTLAIEPMVIQGKQKMEV